jgi:hypothetical protein
VRHLHRFINGVGEPKIIGGDDQAFQISAHFSRRLSVRTESGRIRPFPHAALQHAGLLTISPTIEAILLDRK